MGSEGEKLEAGEKKPHPMVRMLLQHFEYAHLSERTREISAPFAALAREVAGRVPDSPETAVALRRLLEARDAALRAAL
jgi:hypothetical protein